MSTSMSPVESTETLITPRRRTLRHVLSTSRLRKSKSLKSLFSPKRDAQSVEPENATPSKSGFLKRSLSIRKRAPTIGRPAPTPSDHTIKSMRARLSYMTRRNSQRKSDPIEIPKCNRDLHLVPITSPPAETFLRQKLLGELDFGDPVFRSGSRPESNQPSSPSRSASSLSSLSIVSMVSEYVAHKLEEEKVPLPSCSDRQDVERACSDSGYSSRETTSLDAADHRMMPGLERVEAHKPCSKVHTPCGSPKLVAEPIEVPKPSRGRPLRKRAEVEFGGQRESTDTFKEIDLRGSEESNRVNVEFITTETGPKAVRKLIFDGRQTPQTRSARWHFTDSSSIEVPTVKQRGSKHEDGTESRIMSLGSLTSDTTIGESQGGIGDSLD